LKSAWKGASGRSWQQTLAPCAWHFQAMWETQMKLARQVGAGVGVSNGWEEYTGLTRLPRRREGETARRHRHAVLKGTTTMKHRLALFAALLAPLAAVCARPRPLNLDSSRMSLSSLPMTRVTATSRVTATRCSKRPTWIGLHDQSVRLTDFHVAPVCTPHAEPDHDRPRQSGEWRLLYLFRPRVHPPGRADEWLTVFAASGYRTGLFGKWHLGDNYPYRPQDRGFQEVVTFCGWGWVSTSAHWDTEYMDPWVIHNGRIRRAAGYCNDVFFNEAMRWMKERAGRREPFFLYLPTNIPMGRCKSPSAMPDPTQG